MLLVVKPYWLLSRRPLCVCVCWCCQTLCWLVILSRFEAHTLYCCWACEEDGSVVGASSFRGVMSTQLCLQQLFRDEFQEHESCSYRFNFESDPSTTANVFRPLDLWEVNSVIASRQQARLKTPRYVMKRGSVQSVFTFEQRFIYTSVYSWDR